MHELIEYTCFNCYTKFLTYTNILFSCPNCHTNNFKIIKKEFDLNILTGKTNYSKDNFLNEIKKIIKKYPFLCDEFFKLKKIKEADINLLYIPAVLYNLKFEIKLNISSSEKIIKKKTKIKFVNYLNDYSKLDETILNQIKPFDYLEINNHELNLDNIIIEELDQINVLEDIQSKVINMYLEKELSKLKKRYQDVEIIDNKLNIIEEESKVVYLPVYFYNFNYKDKIYRFLMNSSTGKFTYQVVNSKLKISLFIFSILMFTGLFTFCIYMLFESNAFKRWFCYLIIFDIIMLIWMFIKCMKERIIVHKSNLVYEIIQETEGD